MKKTLLVVLLAVSCGQSSTLGTACTVETDCSKGETCLTNGFPGGFCTKGCTREGGLNECPSGTICTRTSNLATTFCSTVCNTDGQCRGGEYLCRAVTDSTTKACAP